MFGIKKVVLKYRCIHHIRTTVIMNHDGGMRFRL